MANWQEPTNTSPYSNVLALIKEMAADAATLFKADPTNHPLSSIRWNRTTKTFEEWNGTIWVPQVIGVPGGGTGASNPGDIGTSLGLGTMAFQNANAVAITGGTAAALTLANCTHNGLFRANASAGALALSVYGNGTWTAQFFAPVGANGILVYGHDGVALQVLHGVTSVVGLMVYGDMKCRMPHRLIIPVGVDLWGVY